MELNDSTRSPLGIDLNEIPLTPSGDTTRTGICGGCGRPVPEEEKSEEDVVVCDACERGYHLSCSGLDQADCSIDWICSQCVKTGVKSRRWPLGKKQRILDINSSPPSDVDVDVDAVTVTEDSIRSRKHTLGDNSFGGNAFVAPVTYSNCSNILCNGNGFGSQKATQHYTMRFEVEDVVLGSQIKDKNFEEIDMNIPLARLGNKAAFRFPSQNANEILLQRLRDYISVRQGVLEEGWHVELRHSIDSGEPCVVYHAPDGKMFDSVFEVSAYLGLSCHSVDNDIRSGESPLPEKLNKKKRKSTRRLLSNGSSENKGSLTSDQFNEFSSNNEQMKIVGSRSTTIVDNVEDGIYSKGRKSFQKVDDALPIQFEDFFILSLGQIDVRPSYHNVSLIYPIGYTSCWHDRVTGSLFMSEVLDGGDSGPIFRVKRFSCRTIAIPVGSTILLCSNLGRSMDQHIEQNVGTKYYSQDHDNDGSIQIILSEPCPPVENDILACLGSNGASDKSERSLLDTTTVQNCSGNPLSSNMRLGDEIGEILVEDRSSSSAWRVMSKKFIDAYSEVYKRKGAFQWTCPCRHFDNVEGTLGWTKMDEKDKLKYSPLEKFCGSPVSDCVPLDFQGCNEFDKLADVLLKWLDQDRYGLDTEFVLETVEQLSGAESCSRYEFLKDRSYYTTSLTIGNGFLSKKKKDEVESKEEEALDSLFGRSKQPETVKKHDHSPPRGKPLCWRLPPQVVGDLYQVWESLWRFHEILDLKEPFSLEELEEGLFNLWFDGSSPIGEFEKKISETETLSSHQSNTLGEKILPLSNESHLAAFRENPHAFINIEVGAMKEVPQTRLTSASNIKKSGVALTKSHSSLLGVLISELQSKVAALVDPKFDSGESKPRRGRKKDVDISNPSKRALLNMLPVNELTWPELTRRYILSVLSMDGILDSAETIARESVRVFRCLQGDGGVLCGSLTGVAGMEADALLLAEATKKVFGSLRRENDTLIFEDEVSDLTGSCRKNFASDGILPDWAQVLEPVRKLPTNVGTRIRKCVYDALEKNPPDWAKTILEHSISKEVYKGNASGPTKKAVLSVLANLNNDSEKGVKRKTVVSVSDIIMKKCRIILRHTAAADEEKVFCNLLGRKLTNLADNDDEGLLGSPAMVSRPLDFRTIDLRLAVGIYEGSHEAFLEDVQELWKNVHNAFSDHPDHVELAGKLSEKFESLYEQEVISLVEKLVGYCKSERLSSETKKEINEILAVTSEIPKAPWDEGVCKICGVDKDDDSVLLCDTCDAEYHTYCLDPPLARIPEGNWYCPSCIASNHSCQDALQHSSKAGRCKGKKYKGEFTRVYLEELRHLAATMEEKEYWEISVDERTFLLKFLCDEMLNSSLIRQHLEQCSETTAELQQKLRSSSAEWKNLKFREENLAVRVAKVETNMLNTGGEVKECVFSEDVPLTEGVQEESGVPSVSNSENQNGNGRSKKSKRIKYHMKDDRSATGNSKIHPQENPSSVSEVPLSNSPCQDGDSSSREIQKQDKLQDVEQETVAPPLLPAHQENCPKEMLHSHATQDVPSVVMNELQTCKLELNTIRNEIQAVQDSITSFESQLSKLAVRREFLGCDSSGRLYWASATSDMHPRVIVDQSVALRRGRKTSKFADSSALENPASSDTFACSTSEGSKACCPFLNASDVTVCSGSQWVVYETDAEIEELIRWLEDSDPKERELKESIVNWKRSKLRGFYKTKNQGQSDEQNALIVSTDSEKPSSFDCLTTKAATLLKTTYGSIIESETMEILKKRGKKARLIIEDKMNRCECLEPIWPSRNHCPSCHRTFSSDVEFEEHNANCNVAPSTCEKRKGINSTSKKKGNVKPDIHRKASALQKDTVETSRSECSEMHSGLIDFQNEGFMCPYDLEEVSSKFMTKDSNKELIQEIGLIGSNGIPLLIPAASPFLNDSSLPLTAPRNELGLPADGFESREMPSTSWANQSISKCGNDNVADSLKPATYGLHEASDRNKPALGSSQQRDKKSSINSFLAEAGVNARCLVPQSSLRPLSGKTYQITRRLKINLLDMDAALPEESLRPSKAHIEKRWAWRAFVKSAKTIYELVQATILLESMIKTEFLRNDWWYWSSLSAAARTCTVSSLALRIYSLDAAIIYEKSPSNLKHTDSLKPSSTTEPKSPSSLEVSEKLRITRRSNKKRKEPEG